MLSAIDAGVIRLALIGLGYVGLPLAVEFGKNGWRRCATAWSRTI